MTSGDVELRARLRAAVASAVQAHLPGATAAGSLGGFLLTFDWIDIGAAAGEHVVVDGRDPKVAARALNRSLHGTARAAGSVATRATDGCG